MMLEDEDASLRAENAVLREQLTATLARIAELEQQRPDPPTFVKPNRHQTTDPKQPRKKRASHQNRGRRREPPTRFETHALERCPECNYLLTGTSIDYSRQVIDLPPPQPVEVVEHQVIKRFCPCCEAWRSPSLDLTERVLGQGHIGVRIIALVAYLVTTLRVPIRRVQAYLLSLHQLTLSAGEITELLHQARRTLQPSIDDLKCQARASPILHGDETGWRENGQNGYIWAFSTPGEDAVRYYEYDHSRGQAVVKRILGGEFAGHLVSDFYCGYNEYAGKHQHCWVHLLRDVHALKQVQAADLVVVQWAEDVQALYTAAQTWLMEHPQARPDVREAQYVEWAAQAHALGLRYARVKKHPCQALAKRLLRHEDELFQFRARGGFERRQQSGRA